MGVCEYYEINKNKWVVLPSLIRAWMYPAALLLSSKKAFCFCGSTFRKGLNSIETIQIGLEEKWEELPYN